MKISLLIWSSTVLAMILAGCAPRYVVVTAPQQNDVTYAQDKTFQSLNCQGKAKYAFNYIKTLERLLDECNTTRNSFSSACVGAMGLADYSLKNKLVDKSAACIRDGLTLFNKKEIEEYLSYLLKITKSLDAISTWQNKQ